MQKGIKAVFMRGGTSKGVFFNKKDLENFSEKIRNKIFLRAIGSPDPYLNQMDGLGGATSSTSKIAVISQSQKKNCDINYNFGAVPVNGDKIDFSGNCGNLSAAAGVFAVEQNMIKKELHPDFKGVGEEEIEVKIYQENIDQIIITKIKCQDGFPKVEGSCEMAGLNNLGSQIIVEMVYTEKDNNLIFPTGNLVDEIELTGEICPKSKGKKIQTTLVNVGNPTVFVRADDINGLTGFEKQLNQEEILLELEEIRCLAGVKMGFAENVKYMNENRPATPKISFLQNKNDQNYISPSGEEIFPEKYDFQARILSMGKLHHAFTATGSISLVAVVGIPGTICSEFYDQQKVKQNQIKSINENESENQDQKGQKFNIQSEISINFAHRSGVMDIMAKIQKNQEKNQWEVQKVGFSRTARSIMRGEVLIPNGEFVE
ncbi:hypothetical protein PPERSA_00081 [Pseudocohnilembus persalinus]|uniref:PrpF protein n=1 Tax=Pseudocohnilembus persalinus TaxID=266149 RepID=A0A0V0QXR7_PSEPJ|nr:hypothetical protein PPERSA_00081 [Pseudocohnilembus persalinus]|eukprot:KRX07171.1 hypothetical protein PPERSA_00081 [Pseudocohnilembus persalinus]